MSVLLMGEGPKVHQSSMELMLAKRLSEVWLMAVLSCGSSGLVGPFLPRPWTPQKSGVGVP